MRELIVRIKDDLNHKLIADTTAEFRFSGLPFDGQTYEIDLTTGHADELAQVMAKYIAVGYKQPENQVRDDISQ